MKGGFIEMSGHALFASCLLIFSGTIAYPQDGPVDYTGYKVIRITPESESQLKNITTLKKSYELDQWNEVIIPGSPILIQIPPQVFEDVVNKLRSSGMTPEIAIPDLQKAIEKEREENTQTGNQKRALENFDLGKYHELQDIYDFLAQLEARYPKIVRVTTIGQSYENRPIKDVTITSGRSGTKRVIVIDAGIHSREWTSISSIVYIINELITKYDSDAEIRNLVDTHEFHIVPVVNPDGYMWSRTRNRMWRKTRSKSSMASFPWCVGADANRNFDIEHCGIERDIRNPCGDIYCGDYPYSESETRTIRDLLQEYADRTKVYFTLHAFSQYWMLPYAFTKNVPPDYKELMRVAQIAVKAIESVDGTVFTYGSIANIIYQASGSSVDYAYYTLGIKYSFGLELRDKGLRGFFLNFDEITPAAKETWAGLKAAINTIP